MFKRIEKEIGVTGYNSSVTKKTGKRSKK